MNVIDKALSDTRLNDADDEGFVLVITNTGRFLTWLLSLFPVWEELSKEEAAAYLLQREVRVRYQPLIIEMDRKTILNEMP